MEYHMLYVESRKTFKVRREKNKIICRVPNSYTRQTYFFAECQTFTLGKHIFLPSAQFCRVFFFQFAECRTLLSVFFTALDKGLVCRVPEEMHSANIKTLGKQSVSGSVCSSCLVLLRLEGEPFINTGDQKRSARSCRMEDEV